MLDWKVALYCMAIVVGAVLVASAVKIIVTKILESKNKTVDKSKMEYPIAAISLICAFVSVAVFLKYAIKIQDDSEILKYAGLYAGTVNTVYLFIVQLIRKGFKGMWASIVNIINKIKNSKNPVTEAPQIIKDEFSDSNTTETIENSADTATTKSEETSEVNAIAQTFGNLLKK